MDLRSRKIGSTCCAMLLLGTHADVGVIPAGLDERTKKDSDGGGDVQGRLERAEGEEMALAGEVVGRRSSRSLVVMF